MTEDMENQVVPGGEPGQATPAASPGATQAPSAIDVKALAEALNPFIEQAVERKWQSGKDKRIAGLTGKVDEFGAQLTRLSELQKAGMSQEDAIWRMRVEDALFAQQPEATPGGNPPQSVPTPQAASANATALLNALGLDANSADVVAVLRETNDFATQAARFAGLAQKAKQAPAPNPAAVQVTGSGANASGEDVDTLTARLSALQNEPSKNINEIKKVSAQLRELLPKK
jgi:hypothetical protein